MLPGFPRRRPSRRTVLATGAAAIAAGAPGLRVDAQSEVPAGEGFAYAAFDRLPGTDIAASHGTVRVGFAPGALALPRHLFGHGRSDAHPGQPASG